MVLSGQAILTTGIEVVMAARKNRYYKILSARRVDGSQAKSLCYMPLWPGETIRKIRLDCLAFGALDTNDRISQLDWGAWLVPVADFTPNVYNTQSGDADWLLSQDPVTTTVDDLDGYLNNLFADEVLTHAGQGNTWINDARGSNFYTGNQFVSGMPPGTVERIFRRENFMEPAFSYQLVGDKFNTTIDKDYYISQPTFLLFGAWQPRAEAETSFNWEYISNAIGQSGGFSMGSRIWDPTAVQALLDNYTPDTEGTEANTAQAAVRAIIQQMQGDNYIEADTLVNEADMMVAVKGTVTVSTPIRSWTIGTG